jgi:uncharacterized membrane protein
MASQDHIRNPIEWGWDQITLATLTVGSLGRSLGGSEESRNAPLPAVCRIKVTDLRDALVRGLDDLGAYRTDVIFLCLIYPLVGISLALLTFGYETLPLLFPLASGFALVGPVAAVGLYEMSRRREQGIPITWADAFGAISSPAFGAILVLGLVLLAILLLWLLAANVIYEFTLGPEPPASLAAFVRDVFTTRAGWAMIVVFGFHRGVSEHEPPTAAYIQIYVKSSVLSRAPDLAISTHLTTEAEIDEFVDDAVAELEKVRIDAKKELAAA